MERIDPEQISKVLLAEHRHRYMWAAGHARGRGLDAGCGAGYGSEILLAAAAVESYLGVDCAAEAIEQARRLYPHDRAEFQLDDVGRLSLPDAAMDTVVCLEVIEHVDDPELVIAELARVLRPEGVFLGSVPLAEYDVACEAAYGPNPYHKTRFSREAIEKLLRRHFAHLRFFEATLEILSLVRDTAAGAPPGAVLEPGTAWLPALGSLLFAGSRAELSDANDGLEQHVRVYPAAPLVDYDAENLTPCRQTIDDQARLIDERDQALAKQARMIDERDQAIADRDEVIAKQTRMIDERDETIAKQTRMIDERDELIRQQDAQIGQLGEQLEQLRRDLQSLAFCLKMTARSLIRPLVRRS